MEIARKRPLGVTILAILAGISGISLIGVGIANGSFGIVLGIIWLIMAWGLWTGKGWAWIITVILTIISIILSVVAVVVGAVASIITLIIDIVILYYLYRPNVKSYFGRGSKFST